MVLPPPPAHPPQAMMRRFSGCLNEQSCGQTGALFVRGRFSCLNKQCSPLDGDLFVRTRSENRCDNDDGRVRPRHRPPQQHIHPLVASFTTQAPLPARTASAKALAEASRSEPKRADLSRPDPDPARATSRSYSRPAGLDPGFEHTARTEAGRICKPAFSLSACNTGCAEDPIPRIYRDPVLTGRAWVRHGMCRRDGDVGRGVRNELQSGREWDRFPPACMNPGGRAPPTQPPGFEFRQGT